MHNSYRNWLELQQYAQVTITAQMHRTGRVENCYGDLDQNYDTDQLESIISTLTYSADDGAERYVASGRIDITAQDRDNNIVVIELKAGKARGDVIGQILGYMGDIITKELDTPVRGIIVASDFDQRVKSASRVISNLSLKEYKIKFNFTDLAEDLGNDILVF